MIVFLILVLKMNPCFTYGWPLAFSSHFFGVHLPVPVKEQNYRDNVNHFYQTLTENHKALQLTPSSSLMYSSSLNSPSFLFTIGICWPKIYTGPLPSISLNVTESGNSKFSVIQRVSPAFSTAIGIFADPPKDLVST